MDSFLKGTLSKVGSAMAAGVEKTKTLAGKAGDLAAKAGDAARRQATAAMGGGSPALHLVGQEVTVRGKQLKIEQLLAEGAPRDDPAAPRNAPPVRSHLARTRSLCPPPSPSPRRRLCERLPRQHDPVGRQVCRQEDVCRGALGRAREETRRHIAPKTAAATLAPPPSSASPHCAQGAETTAQLLNEVTLMSALSHPNIVKVHASENRRTDHGVEIMVVMEYCPGARARAALLAAVTRTAAPPPMPI